jgi:phenylacetate-coenzyme A ligase PaaK-like adenylate-forming protein
MARSDSVVFDAWHTACAYADCLHATRSAEVWRAHRALRLTHLLHRAGAVSSLYRERLASVGEARDPMRVLQGMAPVRKPELMQRFEEWVTDPALKLPALETFVRQRGRRGEAFLDRYIVWESSGSSGEPALFVQDERALAVADALEAARGPISLAGAGAAWPDPWGSLGWIRERIAFVGALDGHFASVVAFERARTLNPWLNTHSRSFSFLQPIDALVAQLNDFGPTVLATYPSMAWVLSEELASGRLRIAPHALWTGGETLGPALRRTLAERFHAPVRNNYGASECFLIGCECRCGQMHLNADWCVLEPVDEHGRAVPEGEIGATTLITNLANQVQPIIRYDIGDRVRFRPERCDCGSSLPVIEVEGRADDVLTLRDADGREVHLPPLALTTVLEDAGHVFDFELRQRGPRTLELGVHDADAAAHAAEARRALCDFLRERGLSTTRVQCRCAAEPVARGRSGKPKRVIAGKRVREHAAAR